MTRFIQKSYAFKFTLSVLLGDTQTKSELVFLLTMLHIDHSRLSGARAKLSS